MTTPPAPTTTAEPQPRLPAPPAGTVRALLQTETVKARFHEVLADKAPLFIASLATLVYASRQLKDCEPYSVIASALKAAALALPIEPSLGFAAIVPYGKDAIFQMQWKGYVQLALRTNQYRNIHVTEVYEGMVHAVDPFTGEIKKGERTGDPVIGYYAFFELLNGFKKEMYMTVAEVQAHGLRYSKTYHKDTSAWKKDPDAMGRKTVIKRLLTRYGILSIEMRQAIQAEIPDEPDAPPAENGNGHNGPTHAESSEPGAPDAAATSADPAPNYEDPEYVAA